MSDQKDTKKKASPWKSAQLGLAILAGLLIYAYGFQITKVDLEDLRSERRQESLVRVMRALAKPEILAYDQREEVINSPLYVTCPAGGAPVFGEPDKTGPYLVITPTCANPGETVQVEGFNFAPNTTGPLRFVPGASGRQDDLLRSTNLRIARNEAPFEVLNLIVVQGLVADGPRNRVWFDHWINLDEPVPRTRSPLEHDGRPPRVREYLEHPAPNNHRYYASCDGSRGRR